MSKLNIFLVGLLLITTPSVPLLAQDNPVNKDEPATTSPRPQAGAKPKPYKTVVTADAITTDGFFKVHRVKDRYLFEIPIKMLGRDILVSPRVKSAPLKTNSIGERRAMFAGDPINLNDNTIAFTKGPKSNIFLEQRTVIEKATDSTDGVVKSLRNNDQQPLIASFDIKAFSPDSSAVVIDLTDFIAGDNDILFFHRLAKRAAGGITKLDAGRSYIESVKTFPINIEIGTVKTYDDMGVVYTYGLNTSLVLLPEVPMKARYADQRVGYFANGLLDFEADKKSAAVRGLVARWRLEPKPEDSEKYFRGELVEPQKPIVIYIDPATPKKWVPYLIAGVNDWQVAFEQAGFKNAIMAREAPTDDPSWSLENAMYSAIVYKPSRTANASGPHISDPRSGEILETHINWFHNVMDLIYKWYFVQCSNVDPRARAAQFDDELMGALIRFVSSHEVGHTLGLKHNFGSSSTVPVELLRNKAWVEANGHTPSIMDYARFNYVAQPEDNISEKGLFPRIGAYDKWAIQWGYKLFPSNKSPEEEDAILSKMTADSLSTNHFLYYGGQGVPDPRNQSEVLGDDPMLANDYGIKNLKAIQPKFKEWIKVPGADYASIREMSKAITGQYFRYINHAINYLYTKYITYKDNELPVVEFVPKDKIVESLAFLNKHYFTTPGWFLYDPDYTAMYGNLPGEFTRNQESVIGAAVLNDGVLNNLLEEKMYDDKGLTLEEYLTTLDNYIVGDVLEGKVMPDYHRKNLQRIYIDNLAKKIITGATVNVMAGAFILKLNATANPIYDGHAIIKEHIKMLVPKFNTAIAKATNKDVKDHLILLNNKLTDALKKSVSNKKGEESSDQAPDSGQSDE